MPRGAGLADKFATTGTKVTFPFPVGVTAATFEAGVDPALQHGLSNVAAVLSNGTDITPTPLVENSTITLELDVPSKGKGLYRFTYDAPPAPPGGKAPAPKLLVESLGTATAPAGTKAPVATPGAPAAKDPVAEKITKYSLSQSYSGSELDALRAAIDQVPEAQLAVVSGLKFARDTAKQNDPAIKLLERVTREFPNTAWAEVAAERTKELRLPETHFGDSKYAPTDFMHVGLPAGRRHNAV